MTDKRFKMLGEVVIKFGANDPETKNFYNLCIHTSNNPIANRVIKKCFNRLMKKEVIKVKITILNCPKLDKYGKVIFNDITFEQNLYNMPKDILKRKIEEYQKSSF